MSPPRARRWPVLALVAALVVVFVHVRSGLAVTDIVWRASVLSWDSPSTQTLDELASQSAPPVGYAAVSRPLVAQMRRSPPPAPAHHAARPQRTGSDGRAPPPAGLAPGLDL